MSYANVLSIASKSAVTTLGIVLRQCQKDTLKVAAVLTSIYAALGTTQAIKTYRAIYQLGAILVMVAYALGMTARELASDRLKVATEKPQEPLAPPEGDHWEVTELSPDPTLVVPPATPYLLPSVPSPIGLLCAASDVPKVAMKSKPGRPKGSKDRSPRRSKKAA